VFRTKTPTKIRGFTVWKNLRNLRNTCRRSDISYDTDVFRRW